MRSRVFPAGLIAVLAACAPSAPPASAPTTASADTDVPPVLALLSERERLNLQPSQVEALESIARSWETANDTLARRVGPTPLRLVLRKKARDAILQNNRRTVQAVAQVLRPDQREAFCTAERLRHGAAFVARTAKPAPGSRSVAPTGKAPGSVRALTAFTRRRGEPRHAWPWCAASVPVEQRSSSAH